MTAEPTAAVDLRPAVAADSEGLRAWANAPDSLVNKLRTRTPIPREAHERWLAARLARADCAIWIVEADGDPVGQIRLEPGAAAVEVDIYIAPEHRRRGLARCALSQAVAAYQLDHPEARIIARVKHDNAPSRALFAAIGFDPVETAADHLVYACGARGTAM